MEQPVPANKCGIVIGKGEDVIDHLMHYEIIDFFPFLFPAICGCNLLILFDLLSTGGESIRQINQMSGAHVEINKATTGNTDFKHFVIRGRLFEIQVVIYFCRQLLRCISNSC